MILVGIFSYNHLRNKRCFHYSSQLLQPHVWIYFQRILSQMYFHSKASCLSIESYVVMCCYVWFCHLKSVKINSNCANCSMCGIWQNICLLQPEPDTVITSDSESHTFLLLNTPHLHTDKIRYNSFSPTVGNHLLLWLYGAVYSSKLTQIVSLTLCWHCPDTSGAIAAF